MRTQVMRHKIKRLKLSERKKVMTLQSYYVKDEVNKLPTYLISNLMTYQKTKNGFTIKVLAWSPMLTVTNKKTGDVVQTEFSDHIQAVLVAKTL